MVSGGDPSVKLDETFTFGCRGVKYARASMERRWSVDGASKVGALVGPATQGVVVKRRGPFQVGHGLGGYSSV